MHQVREYVSAVSVSEAPSDIGTAGLLYVRFDEGGVHLWLQVGGRILQAPTGYDDYLSALTDGILTQVPDHVLHLSHRVPFEPEGTGAPILLLIKEQAWFDSALHSVRFRLEAEVNGKNTVSEADEFDIAMTQLTATLPGQLHVCFTCSLADYISYGGEDLRHGWHCFRDLGVNPALWDQWWDHEDEYRLAMQGVSALHWCPSFRKRGRTI